MKGLKKGLVVLFFASLLVFAFTATAGAQERSKNARLDYNNFKITVNGQQVNVSADREPFAIKGVTYVPLRVVAEAMKSDVKWVGNSKTVVITSSGSSSPAQITQLLQQIAQKEGQIQKLKQQVAQLQRDLADADADADRRDRDDDDEDLSDLEEDLIDDHDEIGDVRVEDIKLDGDEDNVDVEVEVDLGDDKDEWEDLRDSEIEDWIEDVVKDIQDELSRSTEVDGEIIDIDEDEVLVEFSKDGTRSLDVEFEDSDYRGDGDVDEVEDDMKGEEHDVGGIDFKITSISYDKSDDEITVRLKAQDNNAHDKWDDIGTSTKERDVEHIGEDIANEFEDEADVDPEEVKMSFYDEDGDFLKSYTYDVDDDSV